MSRQAMMPSLRVWGPHLSVYFMFCNKSSTPKNHMTIFCSLQDGWRKTFVNRHHSRDKRAEIMSIITWELQGMSRIHLGLTKT